MNKYVFLLVGALAISQTCCQDDKAAKDAPAAPAAPAVFMTPQAPYLNKDTPITDAKITDFFHPANLIFYANSFVQSQLASDKSDLHVLYVGNRTILNTNPQLYPNKTFLGYIAIYQVTSGDKKTYLRVSLEKKDDGLAVMDTAYSQFIEGVYHMDDYFPPRASFADYYKDVKAQVVGNPIWKAIVAAVPDMAKAETFVPQGKTAAELDKNVAKQAVAEPTGLRATKAINTFSNSSDVGPWITIAEVVNDISYIELTASDISLVFHGTVDVAAAPGAPELTVTILKFTLPSDELYVYIETKKTPAIKDAAPYAETVIFQRSLDKILAMANLKLDAAFDNKDFGNGIQNIFSIPFLNYMLVQRPIKTPAPAAKGLDITVAPADGKPADKAKSA